MVQPFYSQRIAQIARMIDENSADTVVRDNVVVAQFNQLKINYEKGCNFLIELIRQELRHLDHI